MRYLCSGPADQLGNSDCKAIGLARYCAAAITASEVDARSGTAADSHLILMVTAMAKVMATVSQSSGGLPIMLFIG